LITLLQPCVSLYYREEVIIFISRQPLSSHISSVIGKLTSLPHASCELLSSETVSWQPDGRLSLTP
jgi:hypothetical protein